MQRAGLDPITDALCLAGFVALVAETEDDGEEDCEDGADAEEEADELRGCVDRWWVAEI